MGAYPLPVEPTVHALSLFYQVFYYGGTIAGVVFFMWFMQDYILPEVMPGLIAWVKRMRKRD